MDEITTFLFLSLVRLLVGIVSFICLLSLDLRKAWKSKAHWVPPGALVLSAFSLQLLGLLDAATVSISDYPSTKEYDLKRVLQNELLIDGGRVMVCVYMGYLLPEMARSPSKSVVWNDIGALALSVFTHIFSELYVLKELYGNLKEENIRVNRWSIASRVCTMVCATMLFILLGSAAFAGRTLYNLVCEKIPVVLRKEPEDYLKEFYKPEKVEDDVLRSWVVAWVCKPDYIIARSVLASSVGVVVTISLGCFAGEWITQDYKALHFNDGLDPFRYVVTGFMALLILIGWIIICWRSLFAIFCFFPHKYKMPIQNQERKYLHVDDFWIRHIFEVMDDIEFPRPSWDQHVSGGGYLQNLELRRLRDLKAHVWLGHLLLCLQRWVIRFSKLCRFLLETILFVNKTRHFFFKVVDPDLKTALQEALEDVMMPGETNDALWDGSVKAIQQMKLFMNKGREDGMDCLNLFELWTMQSTDENSAGKFFLKTLEKKLSGETNLQFDYLTKLSWKMTVLSLIQVIIKLGSHQANVAVNAYSEAYEFLDLLDNPVGAEFIDFVRAADKTYIEIKLQLQEIGPPSTGEHDTLQNALDKVRDLQRCSISSISCYPNDSVDWGAVAASKSLGRVCAILLENYSNSETAEETARYSDFMESVHRLLADTLAIALKYEVGRALVNNCREWAAILEEEKIKASVYIAGKLRGVFGNLNGDMQQEETDGNLGLGKCCGYNFSAFKIWE